MAPDVAISCHIDSMELAEKLLRFNEHTSFVGRSPESAFTLVAAFRGHRNRLRLADETGSFDDPVGLHD